MDYGFLSIAAASITAARNIGSAALALRDFNQVAVAMSQINEQLLKAQDGLFAHNAQLHSLQQDNFSLTNRLREAEEKLAERSRYTLFEVASGTFVLRSNVPVDTGDQGANGLEPVHYICQPCMGKGIKSVLQKCNFFGLTGFRCAVCEDTLHTGVVYAR